MFHARITVTAVAALIGSAMLLHGQTGDQEFKGQVKVGSHKVKLEAGKLYEVILDGIKDNQLTVQSAGLLLFRATGPSFNFGNVYCIPNKTGEYDLHILPGFTFNFANTTFDYTLKLRAIPLADKPVLTVDGKLTDQDPIYQQGGAHFKDYKVKFKKGQLQVIDMVKVAGAVDPYLFLEGPDGKIVARDDDSGGYPNARIVHMPTVDGEFRIIATTLGKATGEFKLTVRQAQ